MYHELVHSKTGFDFQLQILYERSIYRPLYYSLEQISHALLTCSMFIRTNHEH